MHIRLSHLMKFARNVKNYKVTIFLNQRLQHRLANSAIRINCQIVLMIFLLFLTKNNALRNSKSPKFCHITPLLKFLHWLKLQQRIEYRIISITYKTLQSGQLFLSPRPLNVQSNRTTCSSDIITLQRPSVSYVSHVTLSLVCNYSRISQVFGPHSNF